MIRLRLEAVIGWKVSTNFCRCRTSSWFVLDPFFPWPGNSWRAGSHHERHLRSMYLGWNRGRGSVLRVKRMQYCGVQYRRLLRNTSCRQCVVYFQEDVLGNGSGIFEFVQAILWRLRKCLETGLVMFLSSVLWICLDNVRIVRGQSHGSSLCVQVYVCVILGKQMQYA